MQWKALLFGVAAACATFSNAAAEKRIALVIGNAEYQAQARLSNPGNDARRIAAKLRELGFTLVGNGPYVDLGRAAFAHAVETFGRLSRDADVALFYFSGHGLQVNGTNYLMPTDSPHVTAATVELHEISADLVLTQLDNSRARLKIMLLDACRNNPFAQQGKGYAYAGGLATMPGKAGTVIGFATRPGHTASDGAPNSNSPYARALLTMMQVKGLDIHPFLNHVGLEVMAATGEVQQPWIAHSPIRGTIYLNPPAATASAPLPARLPVVAYGPEPPRGSGPSSGASLDYIQLATKQLDSRDYQAARLTLRRGIEADRGSVLPYSYLGYTLYRDGLVSMDRRMPQEALDKYREGFLYLDRGIELDPGYAPARRHRGNMIMATYKALRVLKKPVNDILDRAIIDLKDATRIDPSSRFSTASLGEAYILKGHATHEAGRDGQQWYQLAIASFNTVIERHPKAASAYSGRCKAARLLGQLDDARRDAKRAAELDRDLSAKPCLNDPIIAEAR